MKKSVLIVSILLSAFLTASFVFETPVPDKLKGLLNKLEKYNQWYPRQKVFLHIDKSFYNVDEKIWFKAYVVDGSSHKPDRMSTNLYVDLINPSGHVVQTRLLRLRDGVARGDFAMQDTIPEGRYKIRAYTNWMLNFDEGYFFSKDLYVENPFFPSYATRSHIQQIKKGERILRKMNEKIDVSFHPEGGDLLSGVENKLAFKAINGLGESIDISGELLDSRGNVLLSTESKHLGMGTFRFTPEPGEKYELSVPTGSGKRQSFKLPESIDRGVNIIVNSFSADSIGLKILTNIRSDEFPANTDYYLIAHTRGETVFTAETLLEDPQPIRISRNLFPSGIAHFTLFNARLNPVSERLVFIRNESPVSLDITHSSSVVNFREKVNAKLKLTYAQTKLIDGKFSLAVVKTENLTEGKDIYSDLLLSSDLKGNVENPSWYFTDNNPDKEAALDNLMLTQGWKRFNWNVINMNQRVPVSHTVQEGIEIDGRITREIFNLPLRDIKVTLTILNEFNDVFTTRTDENGRFSFKNLSYPDTVAVKLEAVRASGRKNLVIHLNTRESGNLGEMNYITRNPLRKPGEIGRWVTEKTEEEIERENDPFYEENNRYYRLHREPNSVIEVDENMENFSSVAQIIQGRVPGVMVSGNDIRIRGVNTIYGNPDPLFIVDGVPTDKNYAMNMNPYDIDRIEILKGPEAAIYGSRGANGVIVIYTKRGKFMIKGILDFEMIGYHSPAEFYSPAYQIEGRDENFEDNRSTLLWEPGLSFDSNGEANVNFYTADIPGTYSIIVQGITTEGHPITAHSELRVAE